MSENSSAANDITFFAYDVRKRENNFFIKYVATDYLAMGKITKAKFNEIQKPCNTQVELMDEVVNDASITTTFDLIMLDRIESMEWYDGDSDFVVNYRKAGADEPVRETVTLNNTESRKTFVDAIKQATGLPFQETAGEVGFWRIAQGPLCLGGVGAICLYLGIDGLLAGNNVVNPNFQGNRRGLKNLIAQIYNTVVAAIVC